MTEAAKPPEEAPAEGDQQPKLPILDVYVNALHVSDRIALAALLTAVVASVVAVVQTTFMWIARNDEVEAALRAEQLRACVEYRIAGEHAIARAQLLAEDNGGPRERDADFHGYILTYQEKLSQLYYLLPTDRAGSAVDDAGRASADAYVAYTARDVAELRNLSGNDNIWVSSHDQLIDVCESVIRDLRDN
jgi:hypothetical protein